MLMPTTGRSENRALDCIQILLKKKKMRDPKGEIKTLTEVVEDPVLKFRACQYMHPGTQTHLVRNQGQPHALQVLSLFAEDKVTLLGFGNDEIELHLFSQHRG